MPDVLQPGQNIDRYEVVRMLGSGGMAEVYLVRHATLHTQHALKVLTLTGPGLGRRMADEGRIQAKLDHPNVVRVQDVLDVGGMPALLMDFVDGPDLAQWIHEAAPGPKLCVQIFRGIIEGVSAAHAAGVIHRDLKPSNILLAKMPGGRLEPKVTDFGLVKVHEPSRQNHTRTGIPLGTPQYMAPEQIRDAARVDVRADIFSLGTILYELLSGEQCYPGADLIEIFEKIDRGKRKPLPERIPKRLAEIIDRCLQRDPADRPQSTAELLSLLDSYEQDPNTPDPNTPLAQGEPLRPRRVHVAMIALGLLGSVIVVLALTLLVILVSMSAETELAPLAVEDLPKPEPEPLPCVPGEGRLGVLRAPGVFERKRGDSYISRVPAAVLSEPGGAAVCLLAAGAKIEIVEAPQRIGVDSWLVVDGSKLQYGPADAAEPKGGLVAELCVADEGEALGWVNVPTKLARAPSKGEIWTLAQTSTVQKGKSQGEIVCALPEGSTLQIGEFEIGQKPLFKQFWARVVGGRFRLP